MRLTTISVFSSLTALGLAQTPDLNGLPACAQTPALQGASSSGCSLTDAECFCKNTGFVNSLKVAISSTCTSASDQQAACSWGNAACAAYGISIPCDTSTAQTTGNPGDAASVSSSSVSMPAGTGPSTAAPTDAAGSSAPESSMVTATGSGMNSMAGGSMTSSASSAMMDTMSLMNATHTSGNMTHAPTTMASTTSAGQTSRYTGAGNTAARKTGIIGAVFGVALLFALF